MGLVNAIWSACSVIFVLLVGMFFYHETLTKADFLGITFVLAGVYLIFAYD